MPEWHELRIPCPVFGCNNKKILDWVCAKDDNKMYICEEGRLKCSFGVHNNLMINWRFDCGDRSGVHKTEHFQKPDYNGYIHAISTAGTYSDKVSSDWLIEIIKNIGRQYKK